MKVAIVTGAGSGIGKATTLALLREDYAVVLAGRRVDPLREVIVDAGVPERQTHFISTDVTSPGSVADLFALAEKHYGRVDLLFNNAGIGGPNVPLEELGHSVWSAVIDTNLTGAFLCTQEAFRIMKAQDPRGGRIINNGSISAHVPRPNSAAYTASKHAVTGLTKSTNLDGRAHDIVCGQIDIGNASTELTERMHHGVPQADGALRSEPTIDADHVARAVVYMDSLPLDANVPFMTVMANQMPYMGRG
ncbi:MAG: 3-oxoacyl-ACP reductase [Planctomycetaceae bacterium]|nr:3-oxoacyl-ACP reductase [Planctomycetaceae bacterium]